MKLINIELEDYKKGETLTNDEALVFARASAREFMKVVHIIKKEGWSMTHEIGEALISMGTELEDAGIDVDFLLNEVEDEWYNVVYSNPIMK